ncbi:hypothetical protein HII36_04515 [Nonomuraea sp. NN258]|uniref:hypothetical protein n=1 Tax=Nonomuraea antri TaxID=2730852 RepID=UPI001568887A|nr:hypothetical protein [Nonomuraea antri]NRQ31099.1 hypothetical protein [Nonomuraea antri]
MAQQPPKSPPPQERKASKVIPLTILGALSVMFVGYCAVQASRDEVTADCVDMTQQLPDGTYPIVDEEYCDDDDDGTSTTYVYRGYSGAYRWYYGGTRVGNRVGSGTMLRPSDVDISSRNGRSIQRGGFGSSYSDSSGS